MKQNFLCRLDRLEKLEAITIQITGPSFRYGYLTPLPEDYVGERHIVRVDEAPAEGVDPSWCRFEERPGPEPPADPNAPPVFCVMSIRPDSDDDLNGR